MTCPILRLVLMVWTISIFFVWTVALLWCARITKTVFRFFLKTILSWIELSVTDIGASVWVVIAVFGIGCYFSYFIGLYRILCHVDVR